MSILITGGAGFIGFHLAQKLKAGEETIYLVDNFQRGQKDNDLEALLAHKNIILIEADLTDPQSYNKLPEDVTQIYHLAAMVGVKHCMRSPDKVLHTNLVMTQLIASWAKTLKQPRLLFASTSEIYAGGFSQKILPVPTPEDIPICIEDLTNPRFSYAVSKIAGEMWIRFNAPEAYDFRIVRFHNIYGPRMGFAHVIPEVMARIQKQETPFNVYGHDQTRAFCYVDDAVEQLIAVMQDKTTKDPLFHLGNDKEEIPISKLVQMLFKLCNYETTCVPVAAPEGSVQRRCPDTHKVRQIYTTPFTPLSEGLQKTYAWYQQHLDTVYE